MRDPAQELQDAVTPLAPATEPPVKPEPPVEGKRWNEVYGKMKNLERELSKKEEDFQETLRGIQEHNKMLAERLVGIEDGISEQNRPDPTIDPDGYEKYLEKKVTRQMEKVKLAEPAKPAAAPSVIVDTERINIQASAIADLHDDYDEVLAEVMPLVKADDKLAAKIFGSKNPPAAIYKLGIEQRKKATEKSTNLDQGYVEGGTRPVSPDGDVELTPLQIKVMNGLGLSKEKYVAQLKAGGKK